MFKKEYEEYLQFGGFPEVVLVNKNEDKIAYLKDILNSHIELDVKLLGDVSTSDLLYKLILLLANRVGSKMDFSKIASLLGINRIKVKEYILLLQYTYLIRTIKPFVRGIEKEITKQPKIYFSDTGLLKVCGENSSGAIFENAIANKLYAIGEPNFYEKSSGTEIDFILDNKTAIEVKETPSDFDLKTLERRAKPLALESNILVGRNLAPSGYKDFVWGGNIF